MLFNLLLTIPIHIKNGPKGLNPGSLVAKKVSFFLHFASTA